MLGVYPSILQRAVSSGLYFPFEQQFRLLLRPSLSAGQTDALAGLLAGAANGMATAPINACKYALWRGGGQTRSAVQAVVGVYETGGLQALFRAAPATIMRDLSFGVCYSFLRHRVQFDVWGRFGDNVLAASLATLISSPFNYIRLKQYSDHLSAPSAAQILRTLAQDTVSQHQSLRARVCFLCRSLNVGWGALRVGLGLGLSSQLFELCVGSRSHTLV